MGLSYMSRYPWAGYWTPKLLLMCSWYLVWQPVSPAKKSGNIPRPSQISGKKTERNDIELWHLYILSYQNTHTHFNFHTCEDPDTFCGTWRGPSLNSDWITSLKEVLKRGDWTNTQELRDDSLKDSETHKHRNKERSGSGIMGIWPSA